jgi:hypothetical protein
MIFDYLTLVLAVVITDSRIAEPIRYAKRPKYRDLAPSVIAARRILTRRGAK